MDEVDDHDVTNPFNLTASEIGESQPLGSQASFISNDGTILMGDNLINQPRKVRWEVERGTKGGAWEGGKNGESQPAIST